MVEECPRQVEPHAHPLGERGDPLVGDIGESDETQELAGFPCLAAMQRSEERQVLLGGEARVDVGELERHADASPVVRPQPVQRATVDHLEYEAYRPMAELALAEIGTEVAERWPSVTGIAIAHRVGRVDVGETSVIVAVSAPHRGAALAACAWGIDRLKKVLPVWKKEVFSDGEVWRENQSEGGEPP